MQATAYAPASVANVCVGFDHMGYSMDTVGDTVSVKLTPSAKASVKILYQSNEKIPLLPEKNTASVAALSVLRASGSNYHADLWIEKGIDMSSGMGGSAASAVAAAYATNLVLREPLSSAELIECMLDGEEVASGDRHYDNIIPCYKGGLQLIRQRESLRLPETGWYSTLTHPLIEISTRQAREILPQEVSLKSAVTQCALSMSTIVSIFRSDFSMLRNSMADILIEPHRSALIPQFQQLKTAAEDLGAAGFSISGAGPSVVAWSENQKNAEDLGLTLQKIWKDSNIESEYWVTPIERPGVQQKNEIPEYAR